MFTLKLTNLGPIYDILDRIANSHIKDIHM